MNDLIIWVLIISPLVFWLIKRSWNKIDAKTHFKNSYQYVKTKDYDHAIEELTKVIQLNKKHYQAYNNRGSMWVEKGEYDKAILDYTEAIRVEPNDNYAYFNRGVSYAKIGDHDKAITDLTESIRLNPEDVHGYFYRSSSFAEIDDYEKAIADLSEAIRLEPDDITALCDRAWIYATCRDDHCRNAKMSLEDAMKACELSNWKNSDCITTLAAACAESGDFENALKWIKKAIAMDDDNKNISQEMLSLIEENKPCRS